jgi:hypothetical protein
MDFTKSKPIGIKTTKPATELTEDIHIGTCRSYDEKRPIPSFIRQLGTTTNELPMKNNVPLFDLK